MFAPNDDRDSWRPVFYDAAVEADRTRLRALLAATPGIHVHDSLSDQLTELVLSRHPSLDKPDEQQRRDLVLEHLQGRSIDAYGNWVYYPWSRRLVHVLPRDEYRFLRGDRNTYQIAPHEAQKLRAQTIGVVGLSVGQASALTLAMEGVGGRFRLADFDLLALSNMNRLRTGVHNIGVHKTVVAAREMVEIDPYLEIAIFSEGINESNIEEFLCGGPYSAGKIDLLVEECDDLHMKIRLREAARQHRIPVIMETSDRGLVDIERFDREPERPILHGLIGDIDSGRLAGLAMKDKVPYVLRIIDERFMSTRFAASLVEVKESIYTWPQLASAVALGGALVTNVARRLALGRLEESGRYYVDLDALISDGKGRPVAPDAPLEPVTAPEAAALRHVAEPRERGGTAGLSRDEVRWMVEHAILAPSGGNAQPWRFELRGGELSVWRVARGAPSFLDFEHAASHLALGAAAENLDLAARAIGLVPDIRPFPDAAQPDLAFSATFRRDAVDIPDAFAYVTQRVTNRRRAARVPVREAHTRRLLDAAKARGARLHLIEEDTTLARLGEVLGRADRLRFLAEPLHRELVSELRWTAEETLATRDGIDISTLELPASDAAVMRVLAKWPTMAAVRAFDGGRALEGAARKVVAASSAMALLSIDGAGPAAFLAGGRALESVWLAATACGLAFQPYSAVLYLFPRLDRDALAGLSPEDVTTLRSLRSDMASVVDIATGTPLLLFRLAYADPPRARSLRRPVDEVLSFRD